MLAKTRRLLAWDGNGKLMVVEAQVPELKAGELLIEVKASLVSPGTEMGGLLARRQKPDPSAPPRKFGYAGAGAVLEAGEGCEGITPGMRLAIMGGGYALHTNFAVVPKNLTVPIPEELSFEEGSFCHLAATALQAVRRGELQFGYNVVIVGLGIIGQIAAQEARLSGAHVMGMERLPFRIKLAEELGIDLAVNVTQENPIEKAKEFTRGYGMDVAIIAFGGDADEVIKQVMAMLKTAPDTHTMGTIVLVGGARFQAAGGSSFGNVDFRPSSRTGPGYHDEEWERGRDYPSVFVRWTTRRNIEEVFRFASEGRLQFKPLITHRVPLDKAPEACEELIQHPDRALGVVIQY